MSGSGALRRPKAWRQTEQCGQGQRHDMRRRRDAKDHREQNHPRTPFAPRPLHGVGHAYARVHAAEDAQRSQHFRIWRDAGTQHRGRKTIKRQRRIAAQIAVEPPRDPPDASAQQEAGKEKWQAQEQQDVRHLMTQFPRAQLAGALCTTRFSGLRTRSSPRSTRRLSVSGSPASR